MSKAKKVAGHAAWIALAMVMLAPWASMEATPGAPAAQSQAAGSTQKLDAEYTAKKAGITRARQDEFALRSHQKAIAAIAAGRFKDEIAAVEIAGKKGPTIVDTDESPRADTSLDALANQS